MIVRYRRANSYCGCCNTFYRKVCELGKYELEIFIWRVIVVVFVVLKFYVAPTATVIGRRDYDFKSHPKDWRCLGSNPRSLAYKARSLTTTPVQRLLGE